MSSKTTSILAVLLLGACASDAAYLPMIGAPAPIRAPVAALYLVGDGGLDSPGRDAVLTGLRSDLERHLEIHPGVPALVVFLGDNIYDWGAREGYREEDQALLAAQVEALVDTSAVRGVFLPGNHDWAKGASYERGTTALELQQAWLEEIQGSREVGFLPGDECPGPDVLRIADGIHVFFMDTEWLLRSPEGTCGGSDRFYRKLEERLGELRGSRIVFTTHHPMVTGGPHGGNVGLFENGPFVYYLAVQAGLSSQDLMSGRYSSMLERLEKAIGDSGTRPLAMASGHDHSLQVIRMSGPHRPRYQLVSGSASKSSPAARIEGTRFASSSHGFMRLDFTPEGTRLVVFALRAEADAVVPVFTCPLSNEETETCREAPLVGEER